MKPATLADVAKVAGVSVSLVSLVMSGKASNRCSAKTEENIKAVAKDLGYRANRLARSLKEQQTRTIGLLSVEAAVTPYAFEMLLAAQRTARSNDYDLLFVEVENDPKLIDEALELMSEHQVTGVLVASSFHREIELQECNLPERLVFANCYSSVGEYSTYIPAEYESFSQVLDLLGAAGHKHVGLIIDEYPWPAVIGRTKAFYDAAERYGWEKAVERIFQVADTRGQNGYQATLEMMRKDPAITAIACYNDSVALGAYQAMHELELAIPQQVSVVGFDDVELISDGVRPGLTTVRLPHYAMGKEAVEQLIRICEESDENPKKVVEIRGELVVRDSVSFPRTRDNEYSPKISAQPLQEEEK